MFVSVKGVERVRVPGVARQMGKLLNVYLAPVHQAASRYGM